MLIKNTKYTAEDLIELESRQNMIEEVKNGCIIELKIGVNGTICPTQSLEEAQRKLTIKILEGRINQLKDRLLKDIEKIKINLE